MNIVLRKEKNKHVVYDYKNTIYTYRNYIGNYIKGEKLYIDIEKNDTDEYITKKYEDEINTDCNLIEKLRNKRKKSNCSHKVCYCITYGELYEMIKKLNNEEE